MKKIYFGKDEQSLRIASPLCPPGATGLYRIDLMQYFGYLHLVSSLLRRPLLGVWKPSLLHGHFMHNPVKVPVVKKWLCFVGNLA